jgi:hypothetical protein
MTKKYVPVRVPVRVPDLLLAAALALLPLSACTCGPTDPPPPGAPVGQVTAVPVEGGFELRLSALERTVRSLQIDVKLEGASATAVEASGDTDLVEAGLGVPKDDFTVVVGDTRKLNLPAGAVAKVTTDRQASSISLSGALAVDDAGKRRTVTVVVP